MAKGVFMSLDNMKQLIEIIQNFFKDKYDFTLNVDTELKKLILRAMTEENDRNPALPTKEKNRAVLHVMRDVITQKFELNKMGQEAIAPPAKLGRMKDPPMAAPAENAGALGARLERLEQLRGENKERVPRFEEVHNALDEVAMNEEEFQRRLESMRSEREDNAAEPAPAAPRAPPAVPVSPPEDSLGFHKDNDTRNKQLEEHRIPPTYRQQITQPVPPPTHIEDRYLMINSADRNWLVDTLRYKYRVKFTNSGMPVLRVPIYENNPTVPHTMTQNYSGIRNEWGFRYNGVFYPAYDESSSKGEVIGNEEMTNLTERNAHITANYKDVVSIRVTNVTVPNEITNASLIGITNINILREDTSFEFPHQYILLQIEELQNVYEGTNDDIRRSFCQLQFDRYFKTPNGRGYVILKPVQDERKVFRPTPLAGLPNMTVSLIKPNGELLNDSFDGFDISDIRKENLYVKITTQRFFKKDDVFAGDRVVLKNVRIFSMYNDGQTVVNGEALPVQSEEYIAKFNEFINRAKGHEVITVGDPTTGGMYNHFFVRGPLGIDYATGLLGETDSTSEAFAVMAELGNFASRLDYSLTQLSLAERDLYLSQYKNGQMINLSLQNTISMVVETQVPEVNF